MAQKTFNILLRKFSNCFSLIPWSYCATKSIIKLIAAHDFPHVYLLIIQQCCRSPVLAWESWANLIKSTKHNVMQDNLKCQVAIETLNQPAVPKRKRKANCSWFSVLTMKYWITQAKSMAVYQSGVIKIIFQCRNVISNDYLLIVF